jgi:hypothetical protein
VRYSDRVAEQRSIIPSRILSASDNGFMPIVSIIGVLCGTLFASMAVPANVVRAGSLREAALLLIAGLFAGPVISSLSNVRNFLRTENIIGMAPAYWLLMDLVTGIYDLYGISAASASSSLTLIGLATAVYWVGTMGKPWALPKGFMDACTYRIDTPMLMPIILVCFVLAMLKFAIPSGFDVVLMFKSVFAARWATPWARGSMGGWNAFADHLAYFGYLLPTLFVIVGRRKGWFTLQAAIALLCAAIFMLFLTQSGARRIIGVCLGAALIYWILDQKKIRIWQLGLSLGTIGLLLWFMQVMVLSRALGFAETGFGNASRVAVASIRGQDIGGGVPTGLHVDDNFLRLSQTMDLIPSRYPYVYHQQIIFTLIRPIPRVLWPNKPVDPGFALYSIINSGASLSTTIIGEFWVGWGYIGVFMGIWFFGRLARVSSPFFEATSGSMAPMFYGYITMTLFVGYRALLEVILFSYALGGWWVATWIIKKFRA